MKTKYLFPLMVFLIPFFAFSQQKTNIDSLIRIAISQKSNKNVFLPNKDSLFKRLPFAKSPKERIKLIYQTINYGLENSKEGLNYHYKILAWARKNNDPVSEAVITSELGFNFYNNGDNTEGQQLDFAALKMAEKTRNNQAIGIAYDNLGFCYANNINLSKSYFKKSLQFSKAGGDDLFVAYGLGELGILYYQQHKTDSAIYFEQKAFESSVRTNNAVQVSRSLFELGEMQKDDRLKLKYYWAGASIANAKQDTIELIYAAKNLASYYEQHDSIDSGIFYAKKAYRLSANKALSDQIEPAHLLIQLYKGRNADSTLKYTNIYYADRDSMYSISKTERAQSMAFAEQQRQEEAAAQKKAYQTTLRLYMLIAIIVFLIVLAFVFWRNNRQKEKANEQLQIQKEQIQTTLQELKSTQTQLIQSEKMASLGELTAGIAHEIQNPLNFVNNFSEVNTELIDEMKQEIDKGDLAEIKALAIDIEENSKKINLHGRRADAIVKGMLQHSQTGSGTKEPTNINALAGECMRLAYHGLRAKDKSFNVEMVRHFDETLPPINVIPQDMVRVILNLLNNAFYAVNQKQKTAGADYKPEVSLTTAAENGQVIIKVKDNGTGIPDAIKEKIMQPFFTTKPTGEGTGLGLSLTYDMVVKGHGGSIKVNSIDGEGSEFIVSLPLK